MNREDLAFTPLHEQARLITRGEVSPVELTEIYLDRIGDYDESLGAYLAVTADRALAMARAAEMTLAAGSRRGPLHGIPLVLKDLFDVAGLATTGGSVVLSDNIAERDATVARRLFEAGAVLLGKAHMVEFAFGGAGINHHCPGARAAVVPSPLPAPWPRCPWAATRGARCASRRRSAAW